MRTYVAESLTLTIAACTCGRHVYELSVEGWMIKGPGGRLRRMTAQPSCVRVTRISSRPDDNGIFGFGDASGFADMGARRKGAAKPAAQGELR